jgi:hypothetical protein
MAVIVCSDYYFGCDEGIVQKTISRDVRLKKLGHWEKDKYIIDCELTESVQVTHSIVYYAGASEAGTMPDKVLDPSVIYLSGIQVDFDREDMTKVTYTWTEMMINDQCTVEDYEWDGPSLDECCFGIIGSISRASYKEQVEYKTIMGGTGLDGSDDENPLMGLVMLKPMELKKTLSFTSEKEISDPVSQTIEAVGGCGVGIESGKLVQRSENETMHGFKTWSYTVEKNEAIP